MHGRRYGAHKRLCMCVVCIVAQCTYTTQCSLRAGSSKFSVLRSLIFHANFLESNVFIPVTDALNEIIIHHLQFNGVNLISTCHMMD